METGIWESYIQYGFAGFSAFLLIVVVWLFNKVSKIIEMNTRAYEKMMAALHGVTESCGNCQNRIGKMEDRFITQLQHCQNHE